jgi:cell division protein FtsL
MARKKKLPAMTEFHTVKRIDNSRIVRHVEPVKMRKLYRTVALGGVVAAFFMLYISQHFRCIDLSFQLEDVKARQSEAASLNSSLKLEIAGLRNPMRIDVIARRQLGLTEPLPTQVQEYDAADGAEVAAVRSVRPNRAP